MKDPLKTRAGSLLYRHLPEEYRYRDPKIANEPGDLETYLHGFGHVLDLLRNTLDQAYADGFAEETENGYASQVWLLPYLARLLGTQLLAPDLDGTGTIRRRELNHSVAWSKGKGTLRIADSVSDVLADTETVVVEGWQRTAITPRLNVPPFSIGSDAAANLPDLVPLGTPDLRRPMRAVADPLTSDPLNAYRHRPRDANGIANRETVYWRLTDRRGTPCFPGSYNDRSVTAPDIRYHALDGPGPAPRRITVHVRPYDGFFEPGILELPLTQGTLQDWIDTHPPDSHGPLIITPALAFEMMGLEPDRIPDRIGLTGDLLVPAGTNITFQSVNLLGALTVKTGGNARLREVALKEALIEKTEDTEPSLDARDSLIDAITGPAGFARLEYVTVLGIVHTGKLQASDCIFAGTILDASCLNSTSCVRFSRLPKDLDKAKCLFALALSNTDAGPRFVRRPLKTDDKCDVRTADFGEPGCGVLDLACPPAILAGSEDGMEMGAFHGRAHAARLKALERKLNDQVPLGQTVSLKHDPMLALAPPAPAT